jgi:hypothetical protein
MIPFVMRMFLALLFLSVSLQFSASAAELTCVSRTIAQAPAASHADAKASLELASVDAAKDFGQDCGHGVGHRDGSGCHLVGAAFSHVACQLGLDVDGSPLRVAHGTFTPSDIQEQIERPKW